jgi:hypothetical protein
VQRHFIQELDLFIPTVVQFDDVEDEINDFETLALVSLSEGDSTKYQKSTARSFLTLESPQKTENKAR